MSNSNTALMHTKSTRMLFIEVLQDLIMFLVATIDLVSVSNTVPLQ